MVFKGGRGDQKGTMLIWKAKEHTVGGTLNKGGKKGLL